MVVCRVCLSAGAVKDISELENALKDDTKSYVELMFFCLEIQIDETLNITNKLCTKCYKKVISFCKFKQLALKSDAYLKSLEEDEKVMCNDIKQESCSDDSYDVKLEPEPEIKVDPYESEDELLSTIKSMKYENLLEVEPSKEEPPANTKKKRGRKKTIPTMKMMEICEECGKAVRNLKEHLRRHRPIEEKRKLKCKACDKMFSGYSARYRHYKIKHLQMKPKCTICNKYVVSLIAHHKTTHDKTKLKHVCVSCGMRFISPSALEMHASTHTKVRPFQCTECDKKFRCKTHLDHHRRQVHEKEKTHLCQYCSKSFFKKYHLLNHIRVHTKEKPYKCKECEKWFSSSNTLNSHMLIHRGVREFECPHCDMTFVKSGYLRNHMISHTKERKHPCKYCGVKFGRTDHRKRHEFTAHEKHMLAA